MTAGEAAPVAGAVVVLLLLGRRGAVVALTDPARATSPTRTSSSTPSRRDGVPTHDPAEPPVQKATGRHVDDGFSWPCTATRTTARATCPPRPAAAAAVRAWLDVTGSVLLEFPPVIGRAASCSCSRTTARCTRSTSAPARCVWKRKLGVARRRVARLRRRHGLRDAAAARQAAPRRAGRRAATPTTARTRWSRKLPSRVGVLAAGRPRPRLLRLRGRHRLLAARRATARCAGLQGRRRGQGRRWRWPTASSSSATTAGSVYAIRQTDGGRSGRRAPSGAQFGLRSGQLLLHAGGRLRARLHRQHRRRVYSFAASNGKLAWRKRTGGYVYSSPAVAQVPGGRPTVYFGSYDGSFYALDARSRQGRAGRTRAAARSPAARRSSATSSTSRTWARTTRPALGARTGREVFHMGRGAFNPVISDGRDDLPDRLLVAVRAQAAER